MQAIQEENQTDDEKEDRPIQGEIKKKFYQITISTFNADINFRLDDFKLPSLNEISGGRLFHSILCTHLIILFCSIAPIESRVIEFLFNVSSSENSLS
jgi:hypothetical protein